MIRVLAACLLAFAAGAAAGEGLEHFELDPVHTRIAFDVDHLGLSRPIGTFRGVTGSLAWDPERPEAARLEARIPVASLDLGDDAWNRRMMARTFFHAERHPEAVFRATTVTPGEDGRLMVRGELELRGATAPVTLEVHINGRKRHPYTFDDTIGFSAEARLDRRDFGMVSYPNVIGSEVRLRIEAEAIRRDPPQEDTP